MSGLIYFIYFIFFQIKKNNTSSHFKSLEIGLDWKCDRKFLL